MLKPEQSSRHFGEQVCLCFFICCIDCCQISPVKHTHVLGFHKSYFLIQYLCSPFLKSSSAINSVGVTCVTAGAEQSSFWQAEVSLVFNLLHWLLSD